MKIHAGVRVGFTWGGGFGAINIEVGGWKNSHWEGEV